MLIRPKQIAQESATNCQVLGVAASGTPLGHIPANTLNYGLPRLFSASESSTATSAQLLSTSIESGTGGMYYIIGTAAVKVAWGSANSDYDRLFIKVDGVAQTESYRHMVYTNGKYYRLVSVCISAVTSTIALWHEVVTAGPIYSDSPSLSFFRVGD